MLVNSLSGGENRLNYVESSPFGLDSVRTRVRRLLNDRASLFSVSLPLVSPIFGANEIAVCWLQPKKFTLIQIIQRWSKVLTTAGLG